MANPLPTSHLLCGAAGPQTTTSLSAASLFMGAATPSGQLLESAAAENSALITSALPLL